MATNTNLKQKVKVKVQKNVKEDKQKSAFSPHVIALIADEVVKRLPSIPRTKRKKKKKVKKIENGVFLDTSAIIDGRIFDIINLKLIDGVIVITESILLELKHIADSQDMVKRERGRRGLELLEKMKKTKGIKVKMFGEDREKALGLDKIKEVDERLIKAAKDCKGKIITCDFNLEKKASISGITAINVNTLANLLKIMAVPGDAFSIKVLHKGKDITQGVGYLDDGTMVVIEGASEEVNKTINVVVARVIQTSAGKILFAKRLNRL